MAPLILIIDDEKILATSISIYLQRHAYATMVAHAGEDGVRMAARENPDVAVVDLRLPGIDGLEVLARLRAVSPRTDVIMATAHASVASEDLARKRGAFDFLSKPLDLDQLRLVVARAVGRAR